MIRRTVAGLSLLCAIVTCAFAAQSAMGASATNTTWVTCVPFAGDRDFSDAHCDNNVGPENGKFGHVFISKFPTPLSITNAKTQNNTTEAAPSILKGTILGVKAEITCKTVTGEGEITNEEPQAQWHRPRWVNKALRWLSCVVNKPAGLGCKVKEPIEFNLTGEGVEGLGAGKNEMGMEFKPSEGETFTEITIEGCIFKGTFKATGTAIGTGAPAPTAKYSGATNIFGNEMTKETLKLAGSPAEISSSYTLTMKGGENPVGLTTPT